MRLIPPLLLVYFIAIFTTEFRFFYAIHAFYAHHKRNNERKNVTRKEECVFVVFHYLATTPYLRVIPRIILISVITI